MKLKIQIFKIVLSFSIIASTTSFAQFTTSQGFLNNSIQQEVNKATGRGFDGIIVCINQYGKSTFYTAGFKNRANKVPADPQSLFKIASISKLYMAVATTKLINKQELSLDDTLAQLLPHTEGSIENADKITLQMLL